MIRKHQRFFNVIQVSLDALSLFVAYAATVLSTTGFSAETVRDDYVFAPLWMVPLLITVYYFMQAYTPMRSRIFRKEVLMITRAHLVGIVIIYSLLFLYEDMLYSPGESLGFAATGLILLLLERYLVRRTLRSLRKKGYNQKHMLIIGAGLLGQEFAERVLKHLDFGYNVIGFLDDDEAKQGKSFEGKKVLGCCDLLSQVLSSERVDEVVVALPFTAHEKFNKIIYQSEKAGVRIRIIPDYTKFLPGNPAIEDFDGIPLLNVRKVSLDDPFNRLMKRMVDICVSATAIILLAPLMIFIAVGVKLTSPGPVFFRQQRIGLNNRPFGMLKFRSMRVDTAVTAATTWTTANDPRKTRFGMFLRKTSLDELPQFLNVLKGSMSVVGPRPERPFFVEQFREEIPKYMVKHQVKPGITGWAQVNGWRGDTSIEKRIECDIYYIENWDLIIDVKIMFMTVFKGLVNKNAY